MVRPMLLGLSILVGLHELGHLLYRQMFGMRVKNFLSAFPSKKSAGFQWARGLNIRLVR